VHDVTADAEDQDVDVVVRFNRALGKALRAARTASGLTGREVVARLPRTITAAALGHYEHGVRQPTVVRFVQVCGALGVPATDVLAEAIAEARLDIVLLSIRVDLAAILTDTGTDQITCTLQSWAHLLSDLHDHTHPEQPLDTVRLTPPEVAMLGVFCGLPHDQMAHTLLDYAAAPTTLDPGGPR
jgi:transcriptional regulator with XRE-family HTH domain